MNDSEEQIQQEVPDTFKGKDFNIPDTEPSIDTFDLEAFLAGACTVPVVGVTVYPDADGGRMLYKAMRDRDALTQMLADLETQPNPVLSVGEENPLLTAKEKTNTELEKCKALIAQLEERVMGTALYLEFQVKDEKQVFKAQKSAHAALEQSEIDEMSQVQYTSHVITYIMAAICLRVTNSRGQTIEGPLRVPHAQKIRDSLITAENTKIVNAVQETMNIGNEWAASLDAGFPRRSPDVAR